LECASIPNAILLSVKIEGKGSTFIAAGSTSIAAVCFERIMNKDRMEAVIVVEDEVRVEQEKDA
jgi:hypothetical protein